MLGSEGFARAKAILGSCDQPFDIFAVPAHDQQRSSNGKEKSYPTRESPSQPLPRSK
jgi:hypothetical protein